MGPYVKQLWTVSGVLSNMVSQGMALSFPASLMPALTAPDADIKTDLHTASWIASSIAIGCIPGFFITSFAMDRFGRRIAHFLVMIPGMAGWLLIFFATNTDCLLTGRLLCGFTAGATVGLGAVVIGEYSSPESRGMFLNLKTAAVCIGGMLVHILSNFCTWRTIALVSALPNVAALLNILTWPESPAWLAANGEFEKSETAFFWLRGKDQQSIMELKSMIREQMENTKREDNMSFGGKVKDFFKKFTKRDFIKPIFIIFLGSILLEVSGRHIFPAYALTIMAEITESKQQTFLFTLGIDLIVTVSVIFSSVLVKLMKRRLLLFSTGFASVAILLAACTYLFLVSREIITKNYPWIPLGLFVMFFILTNFGCAPIPLAFLGELLPLEHRGAGSAVAGILMSLSLNLALHLTPLFLVNYKVYGTFAIFGACTAVVLAILYFILPETKDKTLQEIEAHFKGKRYAPDEEVRLKMISGTEVQKA